MSSRSLNKVTLIGNLTRDPELRYTPQGTAVCTFGLATNRQWVMESGEKREEVEFHRIVSWNKLAELCSQLLTKGRKVYVEGRLQSRTWTSQDGRERTTTEIVIDDMILLDSRRIMEEASSGTQVPVQAPVAASQPPSSPGPSTSATTPPLKGDIPDEKKPADAKAIAGKEKQKTKTAETQVSQVEAPKEENVNPDDIPF